jgi:hypothetical protein
MPLEFKSEYQLQTLVAELAGFDPSCIDIERIGNEGDFKATFVGSAGAVGLTRAKADVENVCSQLRLKFRLEV